jgi:hypothetical protein
MMRRLVPALLLLAVAGAHADELRLVLRFQPNASRLAGDPQAPLERLAAAWARQPDAALVVEMAAPADPPRRRLQAARRRELGLRLTAHGWNADYRAAEQDDDSAVLRLRRDDPPALVAAPDLAPPAPPASPPPPPPPQWRGQSGQTLRGVLQAWAGEAGWTLVWQAAFDYPLAAPIELDGDFPAAVAALFKGFAEAKPPPAARLFLGNRVVLVQ